MVGRTEGGSPTAVQWDVLHIRKILPHRYPFLLIDKVVDFTDNHKLVAIKNITVNEPFFNGHFPNRPVMPGVLVIEAMAQAGAILAKASSAGVPKGFELFLVGIEEMKFKRQIVPGDTLRIEMEHTKRRRPLWYIKGVVTVDGKVVASGVISAAEVAESPESSR
jgi:3-hydroxyacyl-[acyl-carrier-protein] dehydratase